LSAIVQGSVLLYALRKTPLLLDNYSRYMDVAIANAKLPYRAPPQPLPVADDPVTQIFLPGTYDARWRFARHETENGLHLLAPALHAYRLEQGAYPQSLSQLSSRYLKAIPHDPLAQNLAFRYKPQGAKYILYSVGPDGKDDKGQSISVRQPERSRRSVQPHSQSDIVAGVDPARSSSYP
jgi:hypothetical protein